MFVATTALVAAKTPAPAYLIEVAAYTKSPIYTRVALMKLIRHDTTRCNNARLCAHRRSHTRNHDRHGQINWIRVGVCRSLMRVTHIAGSNKSIGVRRWEFTAPCDPSPAHAFIMRRIIVFGVRIDRAFLALSLSPSIDMRAHIDIGEAGFRGKTSRCLSIVIYNSRTLAVRWHAAIHTYTNLEEAMH